MLAVAFAGAGPVEGLDPLLRRRRPAHRREAGRLRQREQGPGPVAGFQLSQMRVCVVEMAGLPGLPADPV